MDMSEKSDTAGVFVFFVFLAFVIIACLSWVGVGLWGIEDSFGLFWSITALLALLFLRFTLPISVGVFLCAFNVWDWHWFFAILLAAPGLLFMFSSVLVHIAAMFKR